MSQRILVFENDATFAQEVKTSFERLGALVQVASDGPTGLELAAGNKPDLILLTIELPGMNGFLVCKKIKKTAELENVPLVILSSEVDEETFEQHKKLRTRADDYIRKPIAFSDLFERVKPWVPINGAASAPASAPPSAPVEMAEHEDDHPDAISVDDDVIVLAEEAESTDLDAQAEYERSDTAVSEPPKPSPAVSSGDDSEDLHEADFAEGEALDADEPSRPELGRASEPPFKISNSDRPPAVNGAGNGSAGYASQAAYQAAPVAGAPGLAAALGGGVAASSSYGGGGVSALSSASSAALRGAPDGGSTAQSVAQGVEVERLRRELQAAEEKAQAADKRATAAEQRASGAEKLLDAAKRTGGVSSRELLDLREQLNRKERELLDLREQVTARDKQLIEASEHGLGVERSLQDTRDKQLDLQRELDKKNEVVSALTVDKEASKKRLDDAKSRLDRSEVKLKELGVELDSLKARHQSELESVRSKHAESEEKLRSDHASVVARMSHEHSTSLERAKAEHASALDSVKLERASALENLKIEHAGLLERTQQEHAALLDRTTLDHASVVDSLKSEHASLLARTQKDHAAALEALRREHEEELSDLREEHVVTQKAAAGAAEQDKQHALDALQSEHDSKVRELQAAHADERERASRKHAAELTEFTDKHRQDLTRLGRSLAEAEARHALLEEKHEETESARQSVEQGLRAMTAERDQQVGRIGELSSDLERLKAKQARDEETLARVQKALAIGLGLLDERKSA